MQDRQNALATGSRTILAKALWPFWGEHVGGYVRRLAKANLLASPDDLLRLAGVFAVKSSSGDRIWQTLSELTGLPTETFDTMRWPQSGRNTDASVCVDGHVLRCSFVDVQRLRVCPDCVREKGTTFNRFHLRPVTACARHQARLLDLCPTCSRAIPATRPGRFWSCAVCGFAFDEAPASRASSAELAISAALLGRTRECERLPAEFLKSDLAERVAIVDRLGNLALLSETDAPLDRIARSKRHCAMDESRTLDGWRPVVEQANAMLERWPAAYEEALDGLIDRNPTPPDGTSLEKRFATRAGELALRPLMVANRSPVPFLQDATQRFLRRRLGIAGVNYATARLARKPFRAVQHLAEEADLPKWDYATVIEAATALNGEQSSDPAPWIETGMIRLHRHEDGGMGVPRADVAAAVERLAGFPPRPMQGEWLDDLRRFSQAGSRYHKVDLLRDVLAGKVEAVVARRDLGGLAALAFSKADVERRRAMALIGHWLVNDVEQVSWLIMRRVRAVWGDDAAIPGRDLARLGVHARQTATDPVYSCREVIRLVQSTTAVRIFRDLPPGSDGTSNRWQDGLLEPE